MDPYDRMVQSVRSPVVVGPTSTVGPEDLSQRGRRIPTTSLSLEHFPHCCAGWAIMSVLLSFLLTLRSSARSRVALQLEILALQHQL